MAGPVRCTYQQVTKTDSTFLDQGAFERVTFANEVTDMSRDDALAGTRAISVSSTGASVGWSVTPAFAIGGGVVVQHLSIASSFARYGYATTIFGPFDPTRVDARQTQSADSWGVGWQLGATRTLGSTLRLGAVFRKGSSPKFEQQDSSSQLGLVQREGRFRIPDIFAVGGIWQPNDKMDVIGEVTRISYSRLKHDYVDFQTIATDTADQIHLDDGYEFHIGTEWTIVRESPHISPILRLGFWFDPAHAVQFVPITNSPGEIRLAAALPGTTGQWHYAGGLGIPVSKRLEFNAGIDVSSRSATLSVSTIVRFPRKKDRTTPSAQDPGGKSSL